MKIKHRVEFKFLYNLLEKYIMRFINKIIIASVAAVVLAGCGSEKQAETQTETTETTSAPVVNNDEESGKHALVEECQAKNNDLEAKILAADEALKKADAQYAALKAELVKEKARTDELKKTAIKMEEEYVVDGLMNLPVEETQVNAKRVDRVALAKKHGIKGKPAQELASAIAQLEEVDRQLGNRRLSPKQIKGLERKAFDLDEKIRAIDQIIADVPERNERKAEAAERRQELKEDLKNLKAALDKVYAKIYKKQREGKTVSGGLSRRAERLSNVVRALEDQLAAMKN
jgi:hypothetical protein